MDSELQEFYLEQAEVAYMRSMEDLESDNWEHFDTQGGAHAFKKKEEEGTDVLKIELFSAFDPNVIGRYIFENSGELSRKAGKSIEFSREIDRTDNTHLSHSRFMSSNIIVDPRETILFIVYLELDDGITCLTGCSVDYPYITVSSDAVKCEVKNCIYLFEPNPRGGSSIKFLSKSDIGGSVPDALVNSMISTAVESVIELFRICEADLTALRS